MVVVEQQHFDAALRHVDGQSQPDRPGTDDHDRVQDRRRRPLIGRCFVLELERLKIDSISSTHEVQASSDSHIALSRSAVQMRGSGCWVASSSARVTSNGMQWSKITHWPYLGFKAACVSR